MSVLPSRSDEPPWTGGAAEVLDSGDDYGRSPGDGGAMLLAGTVIAACLFGFIYQLFSAVL